MRGREDDRTKNAELTKTNDFIKEKAVLTPKWNLQMHPQPQEPDNRSSPSRSSPAVARKISATAQSVLGGVKSFLMPTSSSSYNPNSQATGAPANTSNYS